jgi:tripartite-type tricarboxylate transporter receptor subunit TctC
LIGLAVTDSKRADFAPNFPTISEVIPGFLVLAWQGIFAPAKTPLPVLDKLSTEIQAIMRQPDVVARLKDLGADSVGSSREDFSRFVAAEIALWAEVIKANGIKAE